MRNDRQLDRYLQDFRLKLAFDEMTRMPFRIVTQGQTRQKQLELFTDARLGPEPDPADGSHVDDGDGQIEKKTDRDHDARQAIVLSALKAATTPAIRRRLHGGEALTVGLA